MFNTDLRKVRSFNVERASNLYVSGRGRPNSIEEKLD